MKRLKLQRLTFEELAEVMPIVEKKEQQESYGGGNGTEASPYSWDEFDCMLNTGSWNGGYVGTVGNSTYTLPEVGIIGNQNGDSNDCLAKALVYLGAGDSTTIVNHLKTTYPSGVPSNLADSVIKSYFPNAIQVPRSYYNGPMTNSLLWYQTSDTTGHCVNGWFNNPGGSLFFTDPQNDNKLGHLFPTDSCIIYKVY